MFELSHFSFFFDQKFLTSFFQMSNSLRMLKLHLKHIDPKLVKSNLDAFKKNLENLITFELASRNGVEEMKSIKKAFKQ